jgi:hypothetical protein
MKNPYRVNPQLMEKIKVEVVVACQMENHERVVQTIMKEVRTDLILPKLNLLKGTKVRCELVTDNGHYIYLVVGPRDFSFSAKTGVRESSGTVVSA